MTQTMPARPKLRIAIIDGNTLTSIGLQHLLQDIIPIVEIDVFGSFMMMDKAEHDSYAHYFVGSRFFFEHATFFRMSPNKTIVLVNGDMRISGVRTLNVCQSEEGLVRDILRLHSHGHGGHGSQGHPHDVQQNAALLSPREIEVAVLLCKGMINKEVADTLGISVTTAISHRKSIMEKLHARSLADVMIYAVMNGLISV
ncbi:MAG: response regulator transcription factor [Prevotella sp.]